MKPYDLTLSAETANMMREWAKSQNEKFEADPTNVGTLKTKRAVGEVADLVAMHYALQKQAASPTTEIREVTALSEQAPTNPINAPHRFSLEKPAQ